MTSRKSAYVLLVILALTVLFHFAVILRFIPYDIAWGGRLKNDVQMYVFESVSILVNFLLATVVMIKTELISLKMNPRIVNGILWVFLGLFLLNTIGNLVAVTLFEKCFALVTLLLALLIWLIIRDKKQTVK